MVVAISDSRRRSRMGKAKYEGRDNCLSLFSKNLRLLQTEQLNFGYSFE